MKKIFVTLFLILLTSLSSVNLAWAQDDCPCPSDAICICPPTTYKDFPSLINAIINLLWVFALIVAPVIIIIAGFYFVTSMGDPAKVTQAKKMILYAMIGLLIIGFSKGIMALIKSIFE